MNSTLLDLGFFQIKWYSFFLLIAITLAYILIVKEARKKELNDDFTNNLLFYGILIGIIGARIYYVLFNMDYYLEYPEEIIKVWNGGLAIHGGIISTLIFLIIYCKKNIIKPLLATDIIVVALILAQAIGRWGNFFNQEAFGRIVSKAYLKSLHLPSFIIQGMYIEGYYREPTFLYESIFSIIGFIILILSRKSKRIKIGQLTGIYLIWYGIERMIIETFRSDSLMLGNIKVAQLVSLIGLLAGIYLIIKQSKSNLYIEEKVGG